MSNVLFFTVAFLFSILAPIAFDVLQFKLEYNLFITSILALCFNLYLSFKLEKQIKGNNTLSTLLGIITGIVVSHFILSPIQF